MGASDDTADLVVVGAGILGLATARAVLALAPDLRVVVLEKERRVAAHQSGRNSGVIHSGIYYRPGSAKAEMVASGRRDLLEHCVRAGITHELCGKVIVATRVREVGLLHDLQRRGEANGVPATLLGPRGLAELEPHASGLAALHVPTAGIVDFGAVCASLTAEIQDQGATVLLGREVRRVRETAEGLRVGTSDSELGTRWLVNCAGLHADRIAALAGADIGGVRIVPFRGEFHDLASHRRHLVRNLIYPVPDPRFPFLGVHLTRTVSGAVHVGPNAVLATHREGYRAGDVDLAEVRELARSQALWRLAARHGATGAGELTRSLSTRALVRAVRRLVPEIRDEDLRPAPSGVRAQAVDRDGQLLDDFAFAETSRSVHVVNAPSPAATACFAIGRSIAARLAARMGS